MHHLELDCMVNERNRSKNPLLTLLKTTKTGGKIGQPECKNTNDARLAASRHPSRRARRRPHPEEFDPGIADDGRRRSEALQLDSALGQSVRPSVGSGSVAF